MGILGSRRTLVDDVANELSQMVLGGEFQPGAFLPPHKELAARLEVGASTIREAMQILIGMGLIESRSGKGTWVRQDALRTVVHPATVKARLRELQATMVYEARLVNELALTELAAQRATPEDITRIQNALEVMEATRNDSDGAFVKADLEFHLAVAAASKNDLLVQFYSVSRELLAGVIAELIKLPGARDEALRDQRPIAEAIGRHDVGRAREAALYHLGQVGRMIEMLVQPGEMPGFIDESRSAEMLVLQRRV